MSTAPLMRLLVLAPGAKLFMCVYSLLALPNALQRQGGQHMHCMMDVGLQISSKRVVSAGVHTTDVKPLEFN